MNNFERIKVMNADEFAKWLDQFDSGYDDTPWTNWFCDSYCSKCEEIGGNGNIYGWCELNDGGCKFFPNLEDVPDNKETIKMWLEKEVEDEEIES